MTVAALGVESLFFNNVFLTFVAVPGGLLDNLRQ
jgi:hypothetical protein